MAKRKTVPVDWLRAEVNRRNRVSTCNSDIRRGWNAVLEEVLMHTRNYKGFRYLGWEEVVSGFEPGIAKVDGKDTHPDDTRIAYY